MGISPRKFINWSSRCFALQASGFKLMFLVVSVVGPSCSL